MSDTKQSTTVRLAELGGEDVAGRPLTGDEVDVKMPGCSILSVLSENSYGKNFLAYQGFMGRFLLLRVLKKEMCDDSWVFLKAPKIVAMHHENIAEYYDVVEMENELYVLTEHFPVLMTLASLLKRYGAFSIPIAQRVLLDVAKGLAYLVEKQVGAWSLTPEHICLFYESSELPQNSDELFLDVETVMKINDYGLPCQGMESKDLTANFQELAETIERMIGGFEKAPPQLQGIIENLRTGKYEDALAFLRDVESLVNGKKAWLFRWFGKRG